MTRRYPAYRESGVEWLGAIPEHWEILQSRRLFSERKERARPSDKQLTSSQKLGIVSQEEFIETQGTRVMQVITGADILKHVEPNDFVISMRSFEGGLEHSTISGCISSAYVMLIPSVRIFPGFYKYAFKSTTYIQALQSTTNLVRDGQALRYENFCRVALHVPPLPEQTAIAAFLDRETAKIDALVAVQRRLIELLREKRQAVISHAVTKGLNPNARMKPSCIDWLGDVPEGWEVVRLRNVATLNPSKSEVSNLPAETEVSFLPMEAVGETGELDLERTRQLGDVLNGYTYFAEDDVTYAKITPCFENGKGALMRGLLNGFGFGTTELTVLRPDRARILPEFLNCLLSSPAFRLLGEGAMYGAGGQKRVPDDFARDFAIALPSIPEQTEIVASIDRAKSQFDTLTATAETAITLLQERRAALISAAVTGKIDVRHLSSAATEAA